MRLVISFIIFFLLEVGIIASLIIVGRRMARLTEAPGLDIAISLLTWVPWLLSFVLCGFIGLFACVLAQLAALQAFCWWHEQSTGRSGKIIKRTLDGLTSPAKNHIALFVTLPAIPAFLLIRFSELTTYPLLVRLIRLPPYKDSEWVSVSRQKFDGLVGHDLVWCLYCDWMTGIYALGGEMLRNLESFWCPIRFYPGKKCENCKLDFPDIPHWVPPDGKMEDVEIKLREKYAGRTWNSWWGHKERGDDTTPPATPKD
jgi:hypothetical protein